jgi:hypothetical protein
MLEDAVGQCEDDCERARPRGPVPVVHSRPQSRTDELACLRDCVGRHGGVRLVVSSSTDFHVEATGTCGAMALTCAVKCAPPGEAIPMRF